jgi:hypothetical protein
MNSERSNAYGRVMQLLRDMGPSKLQPAEQQAVREAADTLLFAEDIDSGAAEAIERVNALADHLEASERWSHERARELAGNVWACGPVQLVG